MEGRNTASADPPKHPARQLLAAGARLAFSLLLVLIALYFGDQAAEVTRLPFSTLALRDLLNALLMAMMCVVFASWAVITAVRSRNRKRKPPAKEKGGTPGRIPP